MCICARVHVCAEDTFCTSPTDLPGPHGLTQRFPGSQKWCWELGGLGTCSQPRGFQIQFLLKSGSVSATHRSRFRAGGGRVARQTRANLRAPLRPFGGRSQAFLRVPSLPPRLGWGVAGAAHGWGGRGPCVARSVPHGCGTHRLWGGCPLPWFATALLLRVDLRPWTGRLAPWACPEQPDLADFGVR